MSNLIFGALIGFILGWKCMRRSIEKGYEPMPKRAPDYDDTAKER